MKATSTADRGAPYTVAIVAMGPSHAEYVKACIAGSGRLSVADETWAVNAMAGIIDHDRAFIMDDLRYFAKGAREHRHLAGYKDWLHLHRGPVYTCVPHPEFPGAVAYPLAEVERACGYRYFNNTTVYAFCYALWLGVRHVLLYGMDFTQPDRSSAEAGRACLEFWLAKATERGMKVTIAASSTLCDQSLGRPLYGYATALSPHPQSPTPS